jgi:hypothetical protein
MTGVAWFDFHKTDQIGPIEIDSTNLILRSRAQRGVSKDGRRHDLAFGRPSRRRFAPPQDEVDGLSRDDSNLGNAALAE